MVDKLAADNNNIPVEYIFQIHESPCRAVLAITGGGAEIIGELLRHGNGSATVLDAVVPYSTDALDRFLGRKPEKYCSEKTARLMAMVAYQRALDLSKGSGSADREVIGIGATCKLKAANEREGRKHEIHVSIQTACETGMSTLELAAERTREEEEKIAEFLIFNVLARHSNVPEIDLFDRIDTGDGLEEKVIEKYEFVSGSVGDLLKQKMCNQDSLYETLDMIRISLKEAKDPGEQGEPEENGEPGKIRLVFPGSFDPCHRNHVFMAKLAFEKFGEPIHFEISLTNVDKPPIDIISLNQRLDSLRRYKDENFMGSICLTNAPLFLQKA
ncbi:Cytidylyltransferase [Methanosarcina horonobensis HB-1 = JCM 15518]|uniref:Cytidylyltransferase n=2 Tax=Methanosarcina horonobensis TaxID=418008 RepID=A0A0E3SAC7_9EURY